LLGAFFGEPQVICGYPSLLVCTRGLLA